MVNNGGTCLYKEARLNIEPAFPGSTIAFTLPSTSTFGLRTAGKRSVITEKDVDQDEDAFARRHLATDGSMFFRRHHQYPRSFLWRALDNRRMIEIQATDFDHDLTHKVEANLTLILQFPSPIRPFCIAFSEPTERDALTVFAITTSNELYTVNLHRDFFLNPAASEQDMDNWCKRSEPALFSGRVPYRLVSVSVDEILVSLDDGAICRLVWDKDTRSWDGARYQNSNWSVRGLFSWSTQPTVKFDNTDLATSAAAAVTMSPDKQHILSVSLDHTLRAWNVASGKPGAQTDLLDPSARALEKGNSSYIIDASQCKLMTVMDIPGGTDGSEYHIVTYSPKQHQFKFWGIRDANDTTDGIHEVQPDVEFIPPIDELMQTTVWSMEEFHFVTGPAGTWRGAELWIRARSGPSSRVYKLKFDLNDEPAVLENAWMNEWVSVDAGPLTIEALKNNPANPTKHVLDAAQDGTDISESWLNFLFHPGRFTTATLETALVIFTRGADGVRSIKMSSRASLKERICTAISALVAKSETSAIEIEDLEEIVSRKWQAYYSLVKDLHKRRGESLSLAYDSGTSMPWLVLSDHVSVIRSCSDLETRALNASVITTSKEQPLPKLLAKTLDGPESLEVARLLTAASSFRQRLPYFVQQEVKRQIEIDTLQSRSLTVFDRMELIESQSDIIQHVTDEDLALLMDELGLETKNLSTETFLRAIQTLNFEEQGRASHRKQFARFGTNALLRVTQETLEADYDTYLDLLVLVLFLFVELEGNQPDAFDASEVFVELAIGMKQCITASWLAHTVWSHQTATGPALEALYRGLSELLKTGKKLPLEQTVLEGIYGHKFFDMPLPTDLRANQLTYWSRAWISSIFSDNSYESVTEDALGKLLAQKEYDLALDFSKFLSEGNWATYLKGRLHIAMGENALASVCFQKAAYNLALGIFNIEDADSAGLVPETDRMLFSEGLASYYSHIVGLFEKAKAYSYVAEYARLGLGAICGQEDTKLKTELLQRLFTAAIHTSRFEEAYSAMTRHSDNALKLSSLQSLITAMVGQSQVAALLKFPFVGLASDVDNVLSSLCYKTLNIASGPPYHQILYSFRISRNNFRGAASIMYERLQRLKATSKVHDPADESLIQCYLMVINTLASVNKDDAYLLADQKIEDGGAPQWGIGNAKKLLKRQIVTLDTLRKEYQAELDRVAAIESGQFPFVGPAEDMDIL